MPNPLPPSQPAVVAHAPNVLPFPSAAATAQAAPAPAPVQLPGLPLPADWREQSPQTRGLRLVATYFAGAGEPLLARMCRMAADTHDLMRLALVDYCDADEALRTPAGTVAEYERAITRLLMASANARSVASLALRGAT